MQVVSVGVPESIELCVQVCEMGKEAGETRTRFDTGLLSLVSACLVFFHCVLVVASDFLNV